MKYLTQLVCLLLLNTYSFAQKQGIINNTESTHVQLKSINMGDCKWTEGFWADKFEIAEKAMVPYMGEVLCGDVGHALNNFKIAAGMKQGKHQGMRWHDGDFYKWMEAAMYIYAQNGDKKLRKEIDRYIEIIGKAQRANGYLQTQAQLKGNIEPYTNRRNHEMYNTGHLLTSACIHHRITGQRNFLDIAIKHADHLYDIFYPENEKYARFGFNQTQIMGLVELYRTVGDKKYLALAEKFINRRGKYPWKVDEATKGYPVGDMVQERTPLRESSEAVGHAVLALYYYAGAVDVYAETGEQALIDALDRLWENVTHKKMYVTGAVGQVHFGVSSNRDRIQEGFIDEYMMPNLTAYNETCANICNSMFNYRMLSVKGESKHADVMERVLYNSALSGISLEGKDYFYANPLRMIKNARNFEGKRAVTETAQREPYLNCFCCPPNLVRTIAKVSGWAYSLTQNGVAVNLYGGNELNTTLLDGSALNLQQKTQYPWEGKVNITIGKCKKEAFELWLRIPEWAEGATIQVNGKAIKVEVKAGTYAKIKRQWKSEDAITIDLPMTATFVEGHPRIEEIRNQVAVQRGPIIYCIESPDLPEDTDILDVYLNANSELKAVYRPDLLGGITVIQSDLFIRSDEVTNMYQKIRNPTLTSYSTQLVPYFVWSNRGLAEMTVFMPIVWNN